LKDNKRGYPVPTTDNWAGGLILFNYAYATQLEHRSKRLEDFADFRYERSLSKDAEQLSPEEDYSKTPMPLINAQEDSDLDKWKNECQFFQESKYELMRDDRYRGKFVAIKDRTVIDFDADKDVLTDRIDSVYPKEVVLIKQLEIGTRVARFRSPRLLA